MNTTRIHPLALWGALALVWALSSCSPEQVAERSTEQGVPVSFLVSDAEPASPSSAATRSAGGVPPADLAPQILPVEGGGGDGACLIETTLPRTAGAAQGGARTRADISTAITQPFSSIGYRGPSEAGVSAEPWFHNVETSADGKPEEDIRWDWSLRYARFYGVSPQVTEAYGKIALSPASHGPVPYVDFEAETDVRDQVDLMTACSGTVHYATHLVAPACSLAFRHALTAVRFKVGSNLSWGKTISKVEIIGAMSRGRYTLPTGADGSGAAWSGLGTPQTFTLDGLSVSTSEAVNRIIMGNAGDNYTFYMIPQALAGVSVKVHFSDGSTPITANLSGTWKAGTTKTYALSQNTSTWEYQLTVTSPPAAAYTASATGDYTVESYRLDPATGTQQPVAWKVVGYDADGDGVFALEEKPAWLTSLSLTEGAGGTSGERGSAGLTPASVTDRLAARNNALKNAPALGSSSSPYDLSTQGGASARSTANAYVISAPGHYSIPLVYGNAVTGGADNPGSYRTSNAGDHILRNFKDHAGQDITSPYINVQNAPDPATQASLVWADLEGAVEEFSVSGSGADSYVSFRVPAGKIRNGNAVIAVKNASGTVMWSWHLWFAPQDVLSTTEVTNFQGVTYRFTEEALGFKYTSWMGTAYFSPRSVRVMVEQTAGQAAGKQTAVFSVTQLAHHQRQFCSTLYQFGRKDAFPGTGQISEGSFTPNGGNSMSIPNGIQNPGTFYTWGSSWHSGYNQYNLWSMENISLDPNDDPVVKTVYDPCPAGFKMPASNAFTGFTTTGENSNAQSDWNVSGGWDVGWNFEAGGSSAASVYFAAAGYRYYSTGLPDNMGDGGYYWAATPISVFLGYYLNFSQYFVNPKFTPSRSGGFSVRPVSE